MVETQDLDCELVHSGPRSPRAKRKRRYKALTENILSCLQTCGWLDEKFGRSKSRPPKKDLEPSLLSQVPVIPQRIHEEIAGDVVVICGPC